MSDETRHGAGEPGGGTAFELTIIQPGTQAHTCAKLCQGACCKYFSLQVDTPRTNEDFDALRWYLMHEDTHVYKYERGWHLLVNRRCKYLQPNNLCGAYENRPKICADYDPSDCEYTGKVPFDLYFRTDLELVEWLAKQKLAKSEKAKKRRRAAAKTARAKAKAPRRRT